MQDRSPPTREVLLQRTAGPYIWVSLDRDEPPLAPPNVRYSPNSDQNIAAPRLVAKG